MSVDEPVRRPASLNRETVVMALGGRHVVLSGNKANGVYSIGFTRSPKPLLTPEAVKAFEPNPSIILEFHDREAIEVLLAIVKDMHKHSQEPSWRVVTKADLEADYE